MLFPQHPQISKLKVKLPKRYLGKYLHLEEQVRQLLALRRFRYARTAVKPAGLEFTMPEAWGEEIEVLKCPQFDSYLQGHYYPPVEVLPVSTFIDDPIFGSQWGIFAAEDIDSDVLIG